MKLQAIKARILWLLAVALYVALPASARADVVNIASATFKDAASNSYSTNSNTIDILTPPLITSVLTSTGNVGVAFSYQITTSSTAAQTYNATGLPTGLTVNASGLISGTPTTPGSSNVILSATNAAGTGPTATLVLTILGPASITLTKSASVANAKSGDTVTFTIQYRNTGTGSASNVTITDVVPAGSTLVNGSQGTGTVSGSTITWTIGSVTSGNSGSVSFQVTVN